MAIRGRAAVGQGKRYGSPERGYIIAREIYDDLGFGITRKSKDRGLRPGPRYIPDDIIITLGREFLAGKPLVALSEQLGINRRSAYRWLKRLGLSQPYEPSKWLNKRSLASV